MGLASRCRSARDAGRARGVRWIRRIHDFHLLVGTSTTTAGSAFLGTAHLSARRTDRFPTIAPRGRRTSRKPGSASLSPPRPRRVPRETTRPGPVRPPPPTSSPSRARHPSRRAHLSAVVMHPSGHVPRDRGTATTPHRRRPLPCRPRSQGTRRQPCASTTGRGGGGGATGSSPLPRAPSGARAPTPLDPRPASRSARTHARRVSARRHDRPTGQVTGDLAPSRSRATPGTMH